MAVMLKQIDETYEVDTESEAETLIAAAKAEFDVTKSSITYKYRKSDKREFYIVTLRKNFVVMEDFD